MSNKARAKLLKRKAARTERRKSSARSETSTSPLALADLVASQIGDGIVAWLCGGEIPEWASLPSIAEALHSLFQRRGAPYIYADDAAVLCNEIKRLMVRHRQSTNFLYDHLLALDGITPSVSLPRQPMPQCRPMRLTLRGAAAPVEPAAFRQAPAAPQITDNDAGNERQARIALLEQQVGELEEKFSAAQRDHEARVAELETSLRQASRESPSYEAQELIRGLRGRLLAADAELAQRRADDNGETEAAAPLPTSFDALEQFANSQLSGRVQLSRRAIKAARSSGYANPEFVYQVLKLLADDYVMARRGDTAARTRLDTASASLGVRISPVGIAADTTRFREEYRVDHLGKRYLLDMHVSGANARDPRFGFRLYFAWLPEEMCVLVGHMPTHLTNEQS